MENVLQRLVNEHYCCGLHLWVSEARTGMSAQHVLGDIAVAPEELLPAVLYAVHHSTDGLLQVPREVAHEVGLCTSGTDCNDVHQVKLESLAASALHYPDGASARMLLRRYTPQAAPDDSSVHPLEAAGRAFERLVGEVHDAPLRTMYAALRANTFRHPALSQLVSSVEVLSYYHDRDDVQLLATSVSVPGGRLTVCAGLPTPPDGSYEALLQLLEQWCSTIAVCA